MILAWNGAQLFLGVLIVAFGLMINMARHKPGLKDLIEKYVLGEGQLFDSNAPYAAAVEFAGWKSLVTGVGIAIPFVIVWDSIILAAGVLVLMWVGSRVLREYRRAKKKNEEENDGAVTDGV